MDISPEEKETLHFAAMLHDIGKIGIPDSVLLKNGPFSSKEAEEMNTHPIKTKTILDKFHFPSSLKQVPFIASSHHEKVDGNGYPNKLKGEEFPLLSKILAVADVFDALSSRRDYPKYTAQETLDREPIPLKKAIEIIKSQAGTHFDSKVVDAFIRSLPLALIRFRGSHFPPEYVDDTIRDLAPNLLP
jgi:HD-GYP domain-containing protein (c-di-GMP phosphodiesterase class II)